MFGALWLITFKQWRAHRLRVALTTLGIALGVAVFFAIRTGNATLLDSLRATVEKLAGKATLQVSAGEAGFSEKVLDTVRATPGVQLAEPVIETIVQTSFADEGTLLVLGVDTTGDQQLRDYQFDRTQTQISDPLVFLAQPNSILLSRSFADRHGLKVGDKMTIFASDGKKEFTVQGTFKPVGVGEVFGGNVAVMDIYSAQVVFHRGRKFDRIDLMNAAGVPVETVQQRLRAQLPPGVEVDRPEVRGQALENAVTAMRVGILITSFVALLVGVYIIFNSFTIAVNQRWKEIGILRAVGVEQGNVNRMFLGEALLMGVIGSLVGIAGGFILASAANRVMRGMVAAVYGVVATAAPAKLHWDQCAIAFALGVTTSVIGAWFPARGAACLDPAMALHNIEARHRESVLGWKRMGGGLLMILIGSACVLWTPRRFGLPIQFVFATIVLLGLTMVLPKLVLWAAQAMRPAMNWLGGSEGALAVDAMIQTPRRCAATVGALMVGLMFVFSTTSYIQSYRRMMDRWMNQVLNADIFVATSAMLRSTSYHFTEDLGKQIAALPGVSHVENVRFTAIPYRGDTAALIAIEMDGFLARSQSAIEGADSRTVHDQLAQGRGVLVSRNFALRFELRSRRSTHARIADRAARAANRWVSRRLSVGKGNNLHGPRALQKILGRRRRGFCRRRSETRRGPGGDEGADRTADRRFFSRIRLYQCGVQAMDLQPGRPVLHAELHAAGGRRGDRDSGNRKYAAHFGVRTTPRDRHRAGHRRFARADPQTGAAGGSSGGRGRSFRGVDCGRVEYGVHVAHGVGGAGGILRAVLFSVGICLALRAGGDRRFARRRMVAGAQCGSHAGDRGDRL